MNDLMDVAISAADGPYYSRGLARAWPRLLILYCVVLFLCSEEVRFQMSAVEVPGQAERVSVDQKNRTLLRYTFLDPVSGQQRHNTVRLNPAQVPETTDVTVQVLSRAGTITSRLTQQSHPVMLKVVIGLHLALFIYIGGLIAYWAREAHRTPLTRQQRAMVAWRKRKQLEASSAT